MGNPSIGEPKLFSLAFSGICVQQSKDKGTSNFARFILHSFYVLYHVHIWRAIIERNFTNNLHIYVQKTYSHTQCWITLHISSYRVWSLSLLVKVCYATSVNELSNNLWHMITWGMYRIPSYKAGIHQITKILWH